MPRTQLPRARAARRVPPLSHVSYNGDVPTPFAMDLVSVLIFFHQR